MPDASNLIYATRESAIGTILAARFETSTGLAAVLLGDDVKSVEQECAELFSSAQRFEGDLRLIHACDIIAAAPQSEDALMALPLAIEGTAFQRAVWQALRRIPLGVTLSYRELAARLGLPNGARAIARACATNRHALAIPCHRIIRGDGSLSGYRWGIERKQRILDREAAAMQAREAMTSQAA